MIFLNMYPEWFKNNIMQLVYLLLFFKCSVISCYVRLLLLILYFLNDLKCNSKFKFLGISGAANSD